MPTIRNKWQLQKMTHKTKSIWLKIGTNPYFYEKFRLSILLPVFVRLPLKFSKKNSNIWWWLWISMKRARKTLCSFDHLAKILFVSKFIKKNAFVSWMSSMTSMSLFLFFSWGIYWIKYKFSSFRFVCIVNLFISFNWYR